jgi:hypothetical protein
MTQRLSPLEKIIVAQLVRKIPASCEVPKFITVLA